MPYICAHLGRALFQIRISEHGIGMTTSIFGLALNAFWKRVLHIYHHMNSSLKKTMYDHQAWQWHYNLIWCLPRFAKELFAIVFKHDYFLGMGSASNVL